MQHRELPEQEYLIECFDYNPETGALVWRHRPRSHFGSAAVYKRWNRRWAGKSALCISNGYLNVTVNYVRFRAHRVIWKIAYGFDPVGVDHEDGDKSNNRILNLREANHAVNSKNMPLRRDNTSGFPGVTFDRSRRKWVAQIVSGGMNKHLGRFSKIELAIEARKRAESSLGFHINHGRNSITEAA